MQCNRMNIITYSSENMTWQERFIGYDHQKHIKLMKKENLSGHITDNHFGWMKGEEQKLQNAQIPILKERRGKEYVKGDIEEYDPLEAI